MNRVFKSLALTLLAALLIGCGADPHTDTTATTQEEEILLPPIWTTPTNQYLTEDRTRFRVIGDTLYWDVQDPTDPSNNAEWLCHEIPFTEIIGNDSYTCPVRYYPLRMGYMDAEKQTLYLAFDRPVRYADETHPDYFYVAHFLYLSKDGGRTWTPMASPTMSGRKDNMSAVCFNKNGKGCIAIHQYGDVDFAFYEIYLTDDFGATWTQTVLPTAPKGYSVRSSYIQRCRIDDKGTVHLDYHVNTCYDLEAGRVDDVWTYQKSPSDADWTLVNDLPPAPVTTGGK